jgi:hypothetical protein
VAPGKRHTFAACGGSCPFIGPPEFYDFPSMKATSFTPSHSKPHLSHRMPTGRVSSRVQFSSEFAVSVVSKLTAFDSPSATSGTTSRPPRDVYHILYGYRVFSTAGADADFAPILL